MATPKEDSTKDLKELSTAELLKLALPEQPDQELSKDRIREIKRMKRRLQDIPSEEFKEMPAEERKWVVYFQQKRRERWTVSIPIVIVLALWWLLVLAQDWGWINWPLWGYFLDHFVFQTDQPYKGN